MDRNKQMAKESQESIALFSTKIKPTLCPSLFGRHAPNVFFFFLFIFFLFSKSSVVICQQPANPRNNRKTFFIWHLTFPPPFQETFVKTKTKNPFTLCIFLFFFPLFLLFLFFKAIYPTIWSDNQAFGSS